MILFFFIEILKKFHKDIDIMLECKEKDVALFKLVDDIKEINSQYHWEDETTLIVE